MNVQYDQKFSTKSGHCMPQKLYGNCLATSNNKMAAHMIKKQKQNKINVFFEETDGQMSV